MTKMGLYRWTWIGSTIVLLCIPPAHAQEAKPDPPKPMARDADPDWEVATVKPSDPNDPRGQRINLRGRHVLLLGTTLQEFLLLGYGVQQSQLMGEPEWAKTQHWDVDGVPDVDGTPSLKQLQGMMRKILTERFGLVLHHEQRELPVFALTTMKSGAKLIANTSDPNGWFDQQNSENSGRHIENLKNASMADLMLILQFHVDRPIVDQTGLKGRYDFKLQWTKDDAQATAADAPPGLFQAIQDQIGLKLERVKAPADVLVIDKVQRPDSN
jgi:uncharacterized protein (TIGR03435 family)